MKGPSPAGLLPPDNSLLFVYGTLQQGGQYHPLLNQCGARFLGPAHLCQAYPLLLATYPCLLDCPGQGERVEGELYRLPRQEGWVALDHLEAHPVEYRRRLEAVLLGGREREAWVYFYIKGDLLPGDLPAVRRFLPRRGGR